MKLQKLFNVLSSINLKTIYFNFKYLNIKQAIYFPIFISKNVKLIKTNGSVEIKREIRPGIIKIGFGAVNIFDKKYSRAIWEVEGKVVFNGIANIGHGSKISVGTNGTLIIGNNLNITAESTIICWKKVSIGDNCLFSWDTLFMDTDFHTISDIKGFRINNDKMILIGNNTFVGCRSIILKGSIIPNNTTIAANSVVRGKFRNENSIISGNPAKVVLKGIKWS
jgi:acetyltransferase-like isoleucine patch superfamily enzyme